MLKHLDVPALYRETLDEYMASYDEQTAKIERFDKRIEELAAALDQLAEEFDSNDYHDNFSPEEDMVETVALELRCGYAHKYIPY